MKPLPICITTADMVTFGNVCTLQIWTTWAMIRNCTLLSLHGVRLGMNYKTIMENLFNAKIESNDINGDTMLVFSNSIKFKRTHKIENGISVEIKEKLIVDNFEVYNEDLGSFYYADALNYINKLGNGWRIPNKEELNSIYKNREKYSGLENIIKKYK